MPKFSRYIFGKEVFTSQHAVMKHCAAMRLRYGNGQTISNPDDIAFLRDLVAGHAQSSEKIGVGIDRFYWTYAPQHGTTCFWFVRTDGTETEFGVPSCIKQIGPLNKQSLRDAIGDQLATFKAQNIPAGAVTFTSAYSGKECPIADAVVDHVTTFDSIIEQFFHSRGVDIEREMLTKSVDATSIPVFRDTALIEDFLAYHATFQLRIVEKRENLSEIKREANAAKRSALRS